MVTLVGNENDLDDLLEDLITLDFDAAEAYEAAIERMDDSSYREKLSQFREDHLRHTRELGQALSAMGEDAPKGPGPKQYLTKGKVVIANLMGDAAILRAMLSNEADTNKAYERAVDNPVVTPEVKKILQRNLEDERRHKEWIEDTLDRRRDMPEAAGRKKTSAEQRDRP
jgi:rubrerythrin